MIIRRARLAGLWGRDLPGTTLGLVAASIVAGRAVSGSGKGIIGDAPEVSRALLDTLGIVRTNT